MSTISENNCSIAVFEFSSIVRGLRSVDVATKKAAVEILRAEAVSSGKFLLILSGQVAEVEEAYNDVVASGDPFLIEHVKIPFASPAIARLLDGRLSAPQNGDAVCFVESGSMAASVFAVDLALKAAGVRLNRLRLGQGIGGKSFFLVSGTLEEAEVVSSVAREFLESRGVLLNSEVIARPRQELYEAM